MTLRSQFKRPSAETFNENLYSVLWIEWSLIFVKKNLIFRSKIPIIVTRKDTFFDKFNEVACCCSRKHCLFCIGHISWAWPQCALLPSWVHSMRYEKVYATCYLGGKYCCLLLTDIPPAVAVDSIVVSWVPHIASDMGVLLPQWQQLLSLSGYWNVCRWLLWPFATFPSLLTFLCFSAVVVCLLKCLSLTIVVACSFSFFSNCSVL